jgi:hypothetical protein
MSKQQSNAELSGELARVISQQFKAAFDIYAKQLKSLSDGYDEMLKAAVKDLTGLIAMERAMNQREVAALRDQLAALKELHGLEQQRERLQ